METRKIYIQDTAANNVVVLETAATTFGEIRQAAINAGVDIANKDWLEGLTKTTFVSNDSILPTNVPYKGAVTNELFFVLTNTNKKIKSGAITRKECYEYIKINNLSNAIKESEGKNYTNVSTDILINFINDHKENSKPANHSSCNENGCSRKTTVKSDNTTIVSRYIKLIDILATIMSDEEIAKDVNNAVAKIPHTIGLSDEDIKALCM